MGLGSFIVDIFTSVGLFFDCVILRICIIRPPDGFETTPKPGTDTYPQDESPFWTGNKSIADCKPLNRQEFIDWCTQLAPQNMGKKPNGSAIMSCPNPISPDCAYKFSFTSDWGITYHRACNNQIVHGAIRLNKTGLDVFKKKCDDEAINRVPIYVLVLIFLGTIIILAGVAIWAWRRGREVAQKSMARASVGSNLYSSVATQRSGLVSTRPASGIGSLRMITKTPSAQASQASGARIASLSGRSSPASMPKAADSRHMSSALGSASRSHSKSHSKSSSRKRRTSLTPNSS